MTAPAYDDVEGLVRNIILPFHAVKREMKLPIRGRPWENDAEHSWSLAFLACALAPVIDTKLDVGKIAQFAIVHDIVEVYAGDISVLAGTDDQKAQKAKNEREALERMKREYAHFPWITQTVQEYESLQSDEAKFVYALDKYLPVAYDLIDAGKYLHEAKHTKRKYDEALVSHRKKAHTHPIVGSYYDETRRKLDAHPEYFYPEAGIV